MGKGKCFQQMVLKSMNHHMKKKSLKMYHRPDDNGLVLDLSTDYRVGYLL